MFPPLVSLHPLTDSNGQGLLDFARHASNHLRCWHVAFQLTVMLSKKSSKFPLCGDSLHSSCPWTAILAFPNTQQCDQTSKNILVFHHIFIVCIHLSYLILTQLQVSKRFQKHQHQKHRQLNHYIHILTRARCRGWRASNPSGTACWCPGSMSAKDTECNC